MTLSSKPKRKPSLDVINSFLVLLILFLCLSFWRLYHQPQSKSNVKLMRPVSGSSSILKPAANIIKDSLSSIESALPSQPPVEDKSVTIRQRKQNLVLGLAENTSPESLVIYLGSLLLYANDTDVTLFMNTPLSKRQKEIAAKYHAVVIAYDRSTIQPEFIRKYHASSLRWIFYYRYLKENRFDYRKILFADVRDVAFQTNPFADMNSRSVFYAFSEGSGLPIQNCKWNTGWIEDCFGRDVLKVVGTKNIICSGISLASFDAGSAYATIMGRILLGEHELGAKFPACERNGVDQGTHNVVIHLGLVNMTSIVTEFQFPVVNLQNSLRYDNSFDFDLPSMVFDGADPLTGKHVVRPYSIIHQYDRFALISRSLALNYVYWKDMSSDMLSWRLERECDGYTTFLGPDFLAGICGAGHLRTVTPDGCCSHCSKMGSNDGGKRCTAFVFVQGVCYFKTCDKPKFMAKFKAMGTAMSDWLSVDIAYETVDRKDKAVEVRGAYRFQS